MGMLTVRLTELSLRMGRRLSINGLGKPQHLSPQNPQLDPAFVNPQLLAQSLKNGQLSSLIKQGILKTVDTDYEPETSSLSNIRVPQAKALNTAPGAAVIDHEQDEKETLSNVLDAPQGDDTQAPAVVAANQVVPGASAIDRNESDEPETPELQVDANSAVDPQLKAAGPQAGAAVIDRDEEEAPAETSNPKAESKTDGQAPEWKAGKNLSAQEQVLTESTDKDFLRAVAQNPEESERMRMVAERRIRTLG